MLNLDDVLTDYCTVCETDYCIVDMVLMASWWLSSFFFIVLRGRFSVFYALFVLLIESADEWPFLFYQLL